MGNLFERTSLQQLYNDYAFIDILAAGGFLPITFVLYTLRSVRYKSVYLLLLSGSTIIVSAAALLSSDWAPGPVVMSSKYAHCGNANPTVFCYGWNVKDSDFGGDRVVSSWNS